MVESNRGVAHADRGLGLLTLSALVVANMIGAGVFTSSGYSLGALGNPGRVMLAWWLCGAWAIAGAVAYGALARRLPLSGGEYLFLSRLVHPAVGFLAGWISVVAGFTAPIAVAAQGAAIYGLGDVDSSDWRLTWVAVSVIVFATACHLVGVSMGAGLQNAIVAAKLVLLAIIVVWAFGFTAPEAWLGKALPDQTEAWWPEDWNAWTVLVGSMSWVALSYTGFNAAIYVAGQARQPRRTVPQSMLVATIAVTVIYLLLNYVFVYAPAPESIANQNNVAAIAAEAVGGTGLSGLVRLTIVLAMTSSVFAMLLAGPRVYQKMAEDGVMPRIFRTDGGAPRWATLAQALLSIVAVFTADLLQLMKYLGLTLSACGALAVLSLWWARRRIPDAEPLRWWETFSVAVYLLITCAILWASRVTHSDEFTAMLVTFGLGLLVYLVWFARDVSKRNGGPKCCGPYELEKQIGSGREFDVYLARIPHSSRSIVVKVLPVARQTPRSQQRYELECLLLSENSNQHIVQFEAAGKNADGAMYVAVEYVAGETLWDIVKRDGGMSPRRALPLLCQTASALAAVHSRGYLHGDLAPKNIMVTSSCDNRAADRGQAAEGNLEYSEEHITLIDFGLARPIGSHINNDAGETISGTPAFMSPEGCQREVGSQQTDSPASDIYSFGCVAFFMLSGKLPFSGATTIEICWKQLHQAAPLLGTLVPAEIDSELEGLVMKCLQKSPDERPASMQEILTALQHRS